MFEDSFDKTTDSDRNWLVFTNLQSLYMFGPTHSFLHFSACAGLFLRLTWSGAPCCRYCICCLAPTCRSQAPCRLSPRRTPDSGWRKPAKKTNIKQTKWLGTQTSNATNQQDIGSYTRYTNTPWPVCKTKENHSVRFKLELHTQDRHKDIHGYTPTNNLFYWSWVKHATLSL